MSKYPALVQALQQERTLGHTYLVRLDFLSQTMRLWEGDGTFPAVDPVQGGAPVEWSGLGDLCKMSDIDRALVSTAGAPRLTLSGVNPDLLAYALAAGTEVKGRPARIFEQYFDVETQQNVDVPVVVYAGLMDRLEVSVSGTESAAVTLKLVTLLYNRRRPSYAYLSGSSQRRISSTDRGADEMPGLVNKEISWPNYS